MTPLTPAQQQVQSARGNVLLSAGAGTGKTHTLVESCLARICGGDPISLDEMLMVTFTEAAAAELRQRLRAELAHRSAAEPENSWLAEQLVLLDTALISTLHSFCLQLVREHFYALGLDPQVAVLEEEQCALLAGETLDKLLLRHYAGTSPAARAVQDLITEQGRGWDQPMRDLVLRLHDHTQTLRDPAAWFNHHGAAFDQATPDRWATWFAEGVGKWRTEWLSDLAALGSENRHAVRCAQILRAFDAAMDRPTLAAALAQLIAIDDDWPKGRKTALRAPLAELFADAAFLHSLAGKPEALVEDWNWVRPLLKALLDLTREFGVDFARAKRELGGVDFHDLEQFALQLLWDRPRDTPTPIAQQWRQRLRWVFVDEYQDINEAQDAILTALARPGPDANRFLVGDVKQSIYRFRLANPHIFQRYAADWQANPQQGTVVSMSDNFRSHEALLQFLNPLFAGLMQPAIGGVPYDRAAQLRFGNRAGRAARSLAADAESPATRKGSARVELHLLIMGKTTSAPQESDELLPPEAGQLAELNRTEKEARIVARRLRELMDQPFLVWDEQTQCQRPMVWGDIAILLRSPRLKAEAYAKEFARWNIPLAATRSGFYECTEVTDLLNWLQLLDNPLQDLPLLAVLRSPLVGLSANELGAIRLAHRQGNYWTAVRRFHLDGRRDNPRGETYQKVDRFLHRYERWRGLTRELPLSQCLETILDETGYEAWLSVQERGRQRRANVQRLLTLTRQFDPYQRQGLYRFLRLAEAQIEAGLDREPAPLETEDAVRLMSIHQSKGLEFPVVVVADLGKRFNLEELRGQIILDEHYGLCPQIKPPHTGQRYPSLLYWLAKRRQRSEALGEEVRLLYVALTRTRDKLILAGAVSPKAAAQAWAKEAKATLSPSDILKAHCPLDWLGRWLAAATGNEDWTQSGCHSLLSWHAYGENDPMAAPASTEAVPQSVAVGPVEAQALAALRERLAWQYAFALATEEPAKASVSVLRRRANEQDEEARPFFEFGLPAPLRTARRRPDPLAPSAEVRPAPALSAAEIGTAHHTFLQWLRLEQATNSAALEAEADGLVRAGILLPDQRRALDLAALASFWQSDIGILIRQHVSQVHRELPFTARFSLEDLARLNVLPAVPAVQPKGQPQLSLPGLEAFAGTGDPTAWSGELRLAGHGLGQEYVVVQGIVDLAVVLPGEIWILDYKTDQLQPSEAEDKAQHYAPQLALYALALSRIYQLPVTRRWLYFIACRRGQSL